MIAPKSPRPVFILAVSGGRAVVVARDPNSGKWVGPAFYTLATASVGFQAGIFRIADGHAGHDDKGLSSLLSDSFKMGGDAAVAAGPIGTGAQTDLVADLVSFSRAKGRIRWPQFRRNHRLDVRQMEQDLLRQAITASDILVRGSVRSKQASELST